VSRKRRKEGGAVDELPGRESRGSRRHPAPKGAQCRDIVAEAGPADGQQRRDRERCGRRENSEEGAHLARNEQERDDQHEQGRLVERAAEKAAAEECPARLIAWKPPTMDRRATVESWPP